MLLFAEICRKDIRVKTIAAACLAGILTDEVT